MGLFHDHKPRAIVYAPSHTGALKMEAEALETLKERKAAIVAKLDLMEQKKASIEEQIKLHREQVQLVDVRIYQAENEVFLAAAREAVKTNPEFSKLVSALAEEMTLNAVTAQPSKRRGRPPKSKA
jgi:hypothetical protein